MTSATPSGRRTAPGEWPGRAESASDGAGVDVATTVIGSVPGSGNTVDAALR